MSQAYREAPRQHPAQQQGWISRALGGLSSLIFWVFAAWMFSILAEWVGMWLWWPEEGVEHSRRMLEREIGYIDQDFRQSLLVQQPAAYVRLFAEVSYHYLFGSPVSNRSGSGCISRPTRTATGCSNRCAVCLLTSPIT